MEVYFVRHGKTDWNKECKFQGAKNIPLNEDGRNSAKALGEKLSNVKFDRIISSPLDRAYETAQIINNENQFKTKVEVFDLLTEISFGEGEGIPFDDWMNTDDPRKYFFSEPAKYVPPKGGETFESGCKRTKKLVQEFIEPYYHEKNDAKILVVAHGAILAALLCYLENRSIENYWGTGLKGNCEETVYNYDGKKWSLKTHNAPQENPYINFAKGKKMIINKSDDDSAEKTAAVLKNGGVVIIPTDTVYGFSGIVDLKSSNTDFQTDVEIRAIKGRAETKPLIQLIAKPEDFRKYSDDNIPTKLLQKWPGALTIIVHLKKDCNLKTEQETVALRCPGDEWVRKVISLCDAPIFSTSVNRSGLPVLDSENEIIDEFSKEVDLIVKDGDKKNALPSTLVSIDNGSVKILRQGSVQIN